MKSILIEAVSNGWIVRQHTHLHDSEPKLYKSLIFTNVFDLQKQLPELLDYETIEILEPKATKNS